MLSCDKFYIVFGGDLLVVGVLVEIQNKKVDKIFDYLTKYVTVGDLAVMQNENTETPDNNQVEQQTTN